MFRKRVIFVATDCGLLASRSANLNCDSCTLSSQVYVLCCEFVDCSCCLYLCVQYVLRGSLFCTVRSRRVLKRSQLSSGRFVFNVGFRVSRFRIFGRIACLFVTR